MLALGIAEQVNKARDKDHGLGGLADTFELQKALVRVLRLHLAETMVTTAHLHVA